MVKVNAMNDFLGAMLSLIFLEIFIWINILISVFISMSIYFFLLDFGYESAGATLILFLLSFLGLFYFKSTICNKFNIKK